MRGSVLPLMAVGWLGALACGRLGFDPGSEQDDVGIPDAGPQVDAVPAALALTLTATAGVTTLDTELCLTRAAMVRVIVTTDAFETGWTAADLASYADAGPAALLASTALVPASAGCTTFVHPVAGEATAFNVYASAEVAATAEVDLDEAAAALEPTVELVTFDAGAGHTQRYYVSLPERYYRDPSAPLPLLLFLHGAGEDGDDVGANIDLLLTRSTLMRELIDRQPSLANHPFVVVAPQCNANIGACWAWAGQMGTLDQIVAQVGAEVTLDPDRMYVTGLSTGGEGTWNYAQHNPEIDAIVPMANTYEGDASWMPRICDLADVAVWAFHNSDDPTQPASNSQRLVELLAGCAPAVAPQLDIPMAATHNVWTSVYTDAHGFSNDGTTSVFDWLMLH
jgi:poly(3-hydroxybutyrate) depolymerase